MMKLGGAEGLAMASTCTRRTTNVDGESPYFDIALVPEKHYIFKSGRYLVRVSLFLTMHPTMKYTERCHRIPLEREALLEVGWSRGRHAG
jgi:hypothetical protein